MDTCVRYPEYGSQGMATSWMAPDSAGSSSRSKHSSWGPYGHDTTPITPNFPSYTHHTTSPPPAQAQAWGTAHEPATTGWGSPYQAPNQVSFFSSPNRPVQRVGRELPQDGVRILDPSLFPKSPQAFFRRSTISEIRRLTNHSRSLSLQCRRWPLPPAHMTARRQPRRCPRRRCTRQFRAWLRRSTSTAGRLFRRRLARRTLCPATARGTRSSRLTRM